jgi:NaMN:DMB phosphoribosyltransferase
VIDVLISSGIISGAFGFIIWMLKRYIDKKEAKRDEKEKTTEQLILMMLQMGKANNILAEATAKAVQRIPDAKCNGDMTAALAEAEKIKRKEKDFMFEQGVKHIFE